MSTSRRRPALLRLAQEIGVHDPAVAFAGFRADVGVRGRRWPVAGTVCMDMFMVDLGDPDGPGAAVAAGDEAVLFGTGGPDAREVAHWADTIAYEVCCGVSARVPRRYLNTDPSPAAGRGREH